MKRLLSTFLIALTLWLPASPAFAAYSFYRTVTVDHTKVPNTDQSNFPMAVASTTYTFLETVANGGKVQNSEGFDIGFYTSPDCSTGKMAWEVESYSPTTGNVVYWVSASSLSHTSDTVFYMCYGDSSITTDQSATTTVWTNATGYAGVYHFPTSGSLVSEKDSTANAANGSDAGIAATPVTGILGGAASSTTTTDQTGSRIDFGNPSSVFNFTTGMTISAWVKRSGNISIQPNGVWVARWGVNTAYTVGAGSSFNTGNLAPACYIKVGGVNKSALSVNTMSANTWHDVTCVFNGSNVLLYVDGALDKTGSATAGPIDTPVQNVSIWDFGNAKNGGWDAPQDETRLASIARSADWIATEYNNGILPDKAGGATGFYTLGSETAVSVGSLIPKFIIQGFLKISGFLSI